MSRLPSIYYARLLRRENKLGIRSDTGAIQIPTGVTAITLYQLDQWFPPLDADTNEVLGKPFTVSEYMGQFRVHADTWGMTQARDNALKARIRYLYETAYLARTAIGSKAWLWMPDGIEIEVADTFSEIKIADPFLPPPPTISEEAVADLAQETQEEDDFLATLREHGFLPEDNKD
jgi:hypothetical protein